MVHSFNLAAAVQELVTDEGRDYGCGLCAMTSPQLAALLSIMVRPN